MIARPLLALALCVVASVAIAQALPSKFDPRRDAIEDLAAATAIAKAEHKRVIVDVGGEWCSWCHILDRFIERNADVKEIVDRGYVWLKVNWSRENRNEALLSRWPKVAGYPHLFVLDSDGTLLHSQDTGALEAGKGYDKSKFVDFLTRWIGGNRGPAIRDQKAALPSLMPEI